MGHERLHQPPQQNLSSIQGRPSGTIEDAMVALKVGIISFTHHP
jgi:hypothetical protein